MIFFFVASLAQDTTEPLPKCEGFTCPNNDPEGGLYEYGDGCSGTFCDCSYGQFQRPFKNIFTLFVSDCTGFSLSYTLACSLRPELS